jgi:hypothetical protein
VLTSKSKVSYAAGSTRRRVSHTGFLKFESIPCSSWTGRGVFLNHHRKTRNGLKDCRKKSHTLVGDALGFMTEVGGLEMLRYLALRRA